MPDARSPDIHSPQQPLPGLRAARVPLTGGVFTKLPPSQKITVPAVVKIGDAAR